MQKSATCSVADQAHAGAAGLRLLQLRKLYFDNGETAITQAPRRLRAAGRVDQPVAGEHDIGGEWLIFADRQGFRTFEQRGVGPFGIDKKGGDTAIIQSGEGGGGLEVQAAVQLDWDDPISKRRYHRLQCMGARGVGPARLTDIEGVFDAKYVATVECPGGEM